MNKQQVGFFWVLFLGIYLFPFSSNHASLKENSQPVHIQEAVIGNPQAPIVIICYSSFTCLHCAEFHRKVFPHLKQKYIDTGRAFYIMRDYPLDAMSLKASQLARAQGIENYIKNADILYCRQKEWLLSSDPEKNLIRLAKTCGISDYDIQRALKNALSIKAILTQRFEAQKKLGVTHTPTFIINGMTNKQKIEGYISFEQLEKYLEEAENQKN